MQKTVSINMGFVMYPGVQQAAILGLIDFFSVTNQIVKNIWHEKDPLPQINVIKIKEPIVNSFLPSFIIENSNLKLSALVIPPFLNSHSLVEKDGYIELVKSYYNSDTILTSVDNGIFLLAESGVLNGHKVTIHWQLENEFKRKYPKIYLDTDSLLIDDGKFITTAGLLSWSDLGLQLVKRFFNRAVMAEVAHVLLLQPVCRAQSYFSLFQPCLTHGDEAILKGQRWIAEQKKVNITLSQLSHITSLENRTLQRRFIKATGMTITEYLQRFRIYKAQSLLQFTNTPIDIIGKKCGYQDPNAFRKIFTKIIGLSPSLYRKNFTV